MEKQILESAKQAITKSIVDSLTEYNSPLRKMCVKVIENNQESLHSLINDEFSSLLDSGDFKYCLKEALNKKLAQTLINRMGGELESQVNKLKADPAARAKITIAIDNVVKELSN